MPGRGCGRRQKTRRGEPPEHGPLRGAEGRGPPQSRRGLSTGTGPGPRTSLCTWFSHKPANASRALTPLLQEPSGRAAAPNTIPPCPRCPRLLQWRPRVLPGHPAGTRSERRGEGVLSEGTRGRGRRLAHPQLTLPVVVKTP